MAPTTVKLAMIDSLSLTLLLLRPKKWQALSHVGEEYLNPTPNSSTAGPMEATEVPGEKEGLEEHVASQWLDTASGSQKTCV